MRFLKPSAGLLFTLALSATAWSQSTLNFPRGFSPADLRTTGFTIVNPGPADAQATYTLYGAAGQVIATSSQTIPARGQVAKLGLGATELFQEASAVGWVQATSTTAGLQGFWLGGDFVTYGDGAEAAGIASDLIFPLVAGQTEINVANPNASSITVTFRLFGANGLEVAPSTVQPLVGRGFLQSQASSLFSGADLAQATHIRATCTGQCTGTSVLANYLVSPSWGVLNAVDATSTVTDANFPHVISGAGGGGNYTTVIGVTNLTPNTQTVTLTFTPVTGSAQSITRTLPGNGAIRDTAQNLFSLPAGFSDGWMRVTGAAPITGFVAYGESVQGGLAVVPVQGTPRTTMLFGHIADLPPWYTGLVLLNTNTTNATVEVYAMTPAGALIGGADNVPTARFTLNAGTKRAALLSELIPQTQQRTSDGGFVFVRSSVPLYGTELFFTRTLTILCSVGTGAIATGITFTPPTPSPSPPAVTRIDLFYDFENGEVPDANSLYPNTIPTTILTESGGNHFLRMTGVPQDCGPSYATDCPRTRAELLVGHAPETANVTITYSLSLRIPSSNPSGQYNLLAQLFQGVGVPSVSGKTIWLGSQNGMIFVRNDLSQQTLDVGPIQYDRWVDYSLAVYLSTDPSSGLVDVYVDGQHVGSLTGSATLKDSQYVTDLFLNVIDFNGILGIADFDNVQISTGGIVPR